MKVAILGSAPSSMHLAPFGNPEWLIWGCSPGLYANAPRVDAWFELHRPEFGVVGKPATQKQWFSPEYVAWMGLQKKVWMIAPHPVIPNSEAFPVQVLVEKYGNYFFTSSIAWMMAMAIDQIVLERQTAAAAGQPTPAGAIGLWGVDMSAAEEYAEQRPGCQYFIQLANNLGIDVVVPPECDLLRPMPLYGINEVSEYIIKATARRDEIKARIASHKAQAAQHDKMATFLEGAADDLLYHMKTWHGGEVGISTHVGVWGQSPYLTLATPESATPPPPDLADPGSPNF